MCELLLINRPRSTDLDFGPGMTVDVKNDGAIWGRMESKQQWISEGNDANFWPNQGQFVILKLPLVPTARALALLEPQFETDAGLALFDLQGPKRFRARRWRLMIDALPQNARNILTATGEYTTTFAAIRTFIRRFRDGVQYQGFD